MIETSGVTKHYGDLAALEDVSIRIGPGEIVGLLGPNGAGKTTLIRILTGFFEPSRGEVRIDGHDVVADPIAVQRIVGYLPEQTPLYPEMLVQEYLDMIADLRELPGGGERLRLLAEAVWATGLDEHLTRPIGDLSRGFRQRVCLAQAILHRPKVLILDEPTSGLDPSQVVHVRELIRRLAEHSTVLFSTHILSEVEKICERAIILLGGRVCLDARLDEIRTRHGARVAISNDGNGGRTEQLARTLRTIDGVTAVESVTGAGGYATFELDGEADADICRAAFRVARDNGWELGELSPIVRTLETVFRELVATHSDANDDPGKTSDRHAGPEARP